MVFLQFPSELTDEEHMLQAKYAKLRKKKKQLQALKAPKPSETEKVTHLSKGKIPEAKDSKEVAKKLSRSGALIALQKSVAERERNNDKSKGFKRSQGFERKLTNDSRGAMSGYQPFSATHGPGGGFDTGGDDAETHEPPPPKKVKDLYDSFVSARDREERGLPKELGEGRKSDKPRQGNTVYVNGYQITEDILKTTFTDCGKIVNVSMEVEKNCGFVTFDKPESAQKAIQDFNGSATPGGIQLKVTMARRQIVIDPINDASSSSTWSSIAASHSQKGSHKDKRNLVVYDEDVF